MRYGANNIMAIASECQSLANTAGIILNDGKAYIDPIQFNMASIKATRGSGYGYTNCQHFFLLNMHWNDDYPLPITECDADAVIPKLRSP